MFYQNPLTRFLLRKDFFQRVQRRLSYYRRLLQKDLLQDIAFLLSRQSVHTVFDVGANIGFVTHRFQKLFPEAEIYAFEPNPNIFPQLRQAYARSPRVHPQNLGVGDQDGSLLFNINANTGTSSFMQATDYHRSHQARRLLEPIEVQVTTLDSFARQHDLEHIEVLKLDIEGYELKALQGAQQLLENQAIDVIYSEVNIVRSYQGQPLWHELTTYLERQDYHLLNLDSFVAQETSVRQAVIGNAAYLSAAFRKRLEAQFGSQNCGW